MTLDPVDAVAELIRARSMRIDLFGLASYTVRAPCLLAQLADALGVGSETGGRGIPTSRPPLNADAWDLWADIATATHTWADHLGLDRRPYRPTEPSRRGGATERTPAWMTTLAGWLGPVAWDERPESHGELSGIRSHAPGPVRPPAAILGRPLTPLRLDPAPTAGDIPPVGRLLRATLAEAIARGQADITETIGRRATTWAGRIRTQLQQLEVEERKWPLRGVACEECGATAAIEERADGQTYRVPAVEARLQPLPDQDDEQDGAYWPCWCCLACGANAWVQPDTPQDDQAA